MYGDDAFRPSSNLPEFVKIEILVTDMSDAYMLSINRMRSLIVAIFFIASIDAFKLQPEITKAKLYKMFKRPEDMWKDFTRRVCYARLAKRRNRDEKCKMLIDYVYSNAKTMIGQFSVPDGEKDPFRGTEGDFMDYATNTGSLYYFREALYSATDMLAYAKNPTNEAIAASMPKLHQIISDVGMKKKGNLETFATLPADAVEGLKRRGLALPELTAIDDFDLETLTEPEDEL